MAAVNLATSIIVVMVGVMMTKMKMMVTITVMVAVLMTIVVFAVLVRIKWLCICSTWGTTAGFMQLLSIHTPADKLMSESQTTTKW